MLSVIQDCTIKRQVGVAELATEIEAAYRLMHVLMMAQHIE